MLHHSGLVGLGSYSTVGTQMHCRKFLMGQWRRLGLLPTVILCLQICKLVLKLPSGPLSGVDHRVLRTMATGCAVHKCNIKAPNIQPHCDGSGRSVDGLDSETRTDEPKLSAQVCSQPPPLCGHVARLRCFGLYYMRLLPHLSHIDHIAF